QKQAPDPGAVGARTCCAGRNSEWPSRPTVPCSVRTCSPKGRDCDRRSSGSRGRDGVAFCLSICCEPEISPLKASMFGIVRARGVMESRTSVLGPIGGANDALHLPFLGQQRASASRVSRQKRREFAR